MSTMPIHYRIEDTPSNEGVLLMVSVWTPIRETPCGYWVVDQHYTQYRDEWGWSEQRLKKIKAIRFVLKASYKRYCYPTFEEALNSFRIRKQKHEQRLEFRLAGVKEALKFISEKTDLKLEDFKSDQFGGHYLCAGKPDIYNQFTFD